MCYLILMLSIAIPPIGIIGGLYGLYKNFQNWRIFVFCIALGIASVAYCYYPKGDPDLVRYIEYITSLRGVSLADALTYGFRGETNTFMFSAFCWLAAQINDPHIIPALSSFFVYFCGMNVACKLSEDLDINRGVTLTYILFILLSLNAYSIFNNVRNIFAFTIISYAFFRDVYLHKRNALTIILYIFPVFIHQSAVLLILVRLVLFIVPKMRKAMLIVVLFLKPIIHIAYGVAIKFSSGNVIISLIKTLIIRAEVYYNDTSSSWGLYIQNILSFKVERVLNIGFTVIIGMLILYLTRKERTGKTRIEKKTLVLMDYSYVLCILTISCWPMLSPTYWRFYSVAVLFSAVVFYTVSKNGNQNSVLLSRAILLVIPFQVLLSVVRLSNSDLTALLLKPFVSSPVIVLGKALFAL